jgi:competence protein ComEC
MPNASHASVLSNRLIFPALLGWLAGTAWQLQQANLFAVSNYGLIVLAAVLLWLLATRKFMADGGRMVWAVLAMGLLAFGLTGVRSAVFLQDALDPALEGRDVLVTGVIAAMPQRNDAGLRFRLDIESASIHGQAVRLPSKLDLGWYSADGGAEADPATQSQRQPQPVQAGERWQLLVRPKAPHGASNPFGFDYELWLWEQGVQATAYVRAGPQDAAPQRLGTTLWHPIEQLRQRVRDRIFQHLPERKFAGLIAALVVGDQNAIDRWTRTLKSLNGFHSESANF